ncbi:MAG TPA: insulinase family protein [Ignavibacteria bacterium]|nr:insulinase family protein [Ignavibacteria bacterium]
MQKTFNTRTLDNIKVNLLALPNSNYFKMEIVSHYGSNVERVYEKITGKNVYGISHLIEHLSFKTSKDFTTQELMDVPRNEGYHNASTTYDYIDYFFETTAQNMDLAIKYCFNVAYNDLTKVTEKEFETEKNVVLNEIRRYDDDEQAIFYFNTFQAAAGLCEEDNVLGIAKTVATFSLQEAITMKKVLLTSPRMSYNISYDPTKTTEAEIIQKVLEQKKRFQVESGETLFSHADYTSLLKQPRHNVFIRPSGSGQAMNVIFIPLDCDIITGEIVMRYIESLADQTSLNEIIREKHGLTYGVDAYIDTFGNKCFMCINCDVDKNAQEQFLSLFEESIALSVDNFNQTKYASLSKIIRLRRVLSSLNLKKYESLFLIDKNDYRALEPYYKILKSDVDLAYEAMYKACSFKVFSEQLKLLKRRINDNAYSRVSSV